MTEMKLVEIEQEKVNAGVLTSDSLPSLPLTVKTIRTRKKRVPEDAQKKNNSRYYLTLYLAYPNEQQIERLRNMAKAFNMANKLRMKRLSKIAEDNSELRQMVEGLEKERKLADQKYKVWLRRQNKQRKLQNDKEFRETVKALAKTIKTIKLS